MQHSIDIVWCIAIIPGMEYLLYNVYNTCSVVDAVVCRNGIDLILNTKVKAVQRHSVTVSDASGAERDIPFGACVWATGVAMHPVIKQASILHHSWWSDVCYLAVTVQPSTVVLQCALVSGRQPCCTESVVKFGTMWLLLYSV